MPRWFRAALAVVAGLVVWFAVATVGNLGIRWFIPGYSEVEKSMEFSSAMLFSRLALGAAASLAAGAACFATARTTPTAVYFCASLLLVLFVPVHIDLWTKLPVWYHIVFVGSLFPLVVLGARLLRAGATSGA